MTRSMRRYDVPVDDRPHVIELAGSIRHVDCRDANVVTFWAQHDESVPPEPATFLVVGTGHPWPEDYAWVGTALSPAISASMLGTIGRGHLVWHLLRKAGGQS